MIKFFSLFLNATSGLFKTLNGKLAFNLMCRVKQTNKESIPNDFLDRALTTKVNIDGYEGTVYKIGKGAKSVLFLHGWRSHSARWSTVVGSIDLDEFTCYALDAPAHGRSAGDSLQLEIYRKFVINTIADAHGLHAIVAHSLGGLVTAYAYLLDPKIAVDRFIITGAPSGMDAIYGFFKQIVQLNAAVMKNMDNYINANVTKIPSLEIRLDSFFKQVDKPILVIHDEDDRICPIEPIKKGADKNQNIETYFTNGLGHDLQANAVNERMIEFLKA